MGIGLWDWDLRAGTVRMTDPADFKVGENLATTPGAVVQASAPQRLLWLLLIIFLLKGILIALVFPPYSGHDEVAHYAYLRVMAEEGRVPLIPDPIEFDREYRADSDYDDWDMIPDEFYK